MGIRADGGEVQLVVAQHLDHGVLHILALLLDVVVGEVVGALAELVVPPPVLERVVPDARRDRRRRRRGGVRLVPRVRHRRVVVDGDVRYDGPRARLLRRRRVLRGLQLRGQLLVRQDGIHIVVATLHVDELHRRNSLVLIRR